MPVAYTRSIKNLNGYPIEDAVARRMSSEETIYNVIDKYLSENRNYLEQDGTTVKEDIDTLKKNVHEITSIINNIHGGVVRDIRNGIPHASTAEDYFNALRTDGVYQTKEWLHAFNPTSTCIKQLDNAGLVCRPSTDTEEGIDDYADIPLFNWFYCNYVRDEFGDPYVTAIKGADPEYTEDGSADVGVIQMSFYWNVEKKDTYKLWTISAKPNADYGLVEYVAAKRHDGSFAPYIIHSAFQSSIAPDGKLRSFPNSKIANRHSYNTVLDTYPEKGPGYTGAGVERNTFLILMNMIKYGTKNSQKNFAGCTNAFYQYSASIIRTNKQRYFPVTNLQAETIIIGSNVSIGYGCLIGTNIRYDRNDESIRAYVENATVTRIETIDENNKAVYLDDIPEGFTTERVNIAEGLDSDIVITSTGWNTGTTMNVLGKHDGSMGSNTNGKYPCRIQGLETMTGFWMVASDAMSIVREDMSKDIYVAPKYVAHTKDPNEVMRTYKFIGNVPAVSGGANYWIGDVDIDVELAAWYPSTVGSSDAQGTGDIVDAGSTSTYGERVFITNGCISDTANAGLTHLSFWCLPSYEGIEFSSCD